MRRRVLIAALAAVMAAGLLLPGCEKKEFDAATYVQAMMDATYHDSPEGFVEMELGKKSDAEKMHDETVDALTEALSDILGEGINEDIKKSLRKTVDSLCMKTDYEVGEALEDNGVYKVEVNIKPLELSFAFEGEEFNKQAEEAVKASMKDKKDITEEELSSVLTRLLVQQLQKVEKEPTYSGEQTVTVTVRKKDDLYEIPAADWEVVDQRLIR